MRISGWYVLAFLAVVIGVTVAVFPLKRDMVVYYLEAGQLKKARWLLDELLERHPDDPDVLLAASRIYQLEGRPRKAIEALNTVLAERPGDLQALTLLAKYYEWSVQPRKAAEAYERILAITPDRPDVLVKLVGWYRYFDMTDEEITSIVRLVPLVRAKDERIGGPMARDLLAELARLAGERKENDSDPYRSYLIQRLFVLLQQWIREIDEGGKPDFRQYAIYAVEYFLAVGDGPGAERFVENLDRDAGGFTARLAYVSVLRWNGKFEQALAFLDKLEKRYPDEERVILAKARTGKDADNLEVAESALNRLTVLNPDNEDYRDELARIYLRQEKYGQAVMVYQKLIARAKEAARFVRSMLFAALGGGDKELMRRAAATAEAVENPGREIKDALITTYLSLDEPAKAFPLLLEKAESGDSDRDTVLDLLDVAGYTARPDMVDKAAGLALARYPDDLDVLGQVAAAYTSAGLHARAFEYYKRLFAATGSAADGKAMLEAAGYEAGEPLIAEAASLAMRKRPDDRVLMALAGEVFLWISKPRQAYPYLKRAAALSGGRGADVDRMLAAASYTGDPKLMMDAAVTAQALRPEDRQLAVMAAEYLYQAGDVKAGSRIMDRLATLTHEDKAVLLKHARMAEAAGANDQAFRLYKRLYDSFPEDTALRDDVIRLAGWTGRPGVAAAILGAMSDESPKNFKLAKDAGWAWGDAGKPEKAVAYLARAHRLKPGDLPVLERLAEFYGYAGMAAEQVAALKELEKIKPLTGEQKYVLARAYVDENKGAEALPYLEAALAGRPPDKDQGLLLARALTLAGQGAGADRVFMDLGARYAGDPDYLARLGVEAMWAERTGAAQGLFDMALVADPRQPTALRGSAMLAAATSRDRKAAGLLRRYLEVKPDDAEARYLLGQVYDARDRPGMAVGQYRKALRLLERKEAGL